MGERFLSDQEHVVQLWGVCVNKPDIDIDMVHTCATQPAQPQHMHTLTPALTVTPAQSQHVCTHFHTTTAHTHTHTTAKPQHMCTHTCTHTVCAHTQPLNTLTLTHMHTLTPANTHICSCTALCTHMCTPSTCMHSHLHTHKCGTHSRHTHSHMHKLAPHTITPVHTHTYVCTARLIHGGDMLGLSLSTSLAHLKTVPAGRL